MEDFHGKIIREGDQVYRCGHPSSKSQKFTVLKVYPARIKINKPTWISDYTIVHSDLMITLGNIG